MEKISLEKWRNIHTDYKGYINGQPYMLKNQNGTTISVPVEVDRSIPSKATSNKFIGVWTRGMMALFPEVRAAIEKEFNIAVKDHEDWFYSVVVNGQKFFICDNGEFGYTAMLPDEY